MIIISLKIITICSATAAAATKRRYQNCFCDCGQRVIDVYCVRCVPANGRRYPNEPERRPIAVHRGRSRETHAAYATTADGRRATCTAQRRAQGVRRHLHHNSCYRYHCVSFVCKYYFLFFLSAAAKGTV